MIHRIEIDLEEITDFKSTREKQKLINHILCNMSDFDYRQTLKKQLQDNLDAEEEFENRIDIKAAFKILIDKY